MARPILPTSGADERSLRASPREGGLSFVAHGACITGDIVTDGTIKIEGTVVGSIRASRQVLIAKGGRIEGDIFTHEAIVAGRVRGSIQADERVEIQGGSTVDGDIVARVMLIQEGGEVNGHVRMAGAEAAKPHSGTTPSGVSAVA